jgi:hypothetical protein
MGDDFRTRVASLLSNHQAAKQKTEDALRQMHEREDRARADFDRLRDDFFHPVMQELADTLKASGYQAEVKNVDTVNRIPIVESAITLFIGGGPTLSTITYRHGAPALIINGRHDRRPLPTSRDALEQQLLGVLEEIFRTSITDV